jgi:hypothetical protein
MFRNCRLLEFNFRDVVSCRMILSGSSRRSLGLALKAARAILLSRSRTLIPRPVHRTHHHSVTIRGTSDHGENVHLASRIVIQREVIPVHRGMIGSETIVRPMIDKQVLDSRDKERRPIE